MKTTILNFDTLNEYDHMLACIKGKGFKYRLQTTITGINSIELYYNSVQQLKDLQKESIIKLQTSLFEI